MGSASGGRVGNLIFESREERALRRARENERRMAALAASKARQADLDARRAQGELRTPDREQVLRRAGVSEGELNAANVTMEARRSEIEEYHQRFEAERCRDAEAARGDAAMLALAHALPQLAKHRAGQEKRTHNLLVASTRRNETRRRATGPEIDALLERARSGEKLEALAAEAQAKRICGRATLYRRARSAGITLLRSKKSLTRSR
jgi:hypothetical protein